MNYVKEAEQILYHYRDLEQSVEKMTERIDVLIARARPRELKAADIEDMIRKGGKDATINALYEIKELMDSKSKTRAELWHVDRVLDDISKDKDCKYYGPVLRKWYIEKVNKEDIATEIGYSSKQSVYDVKNAAIRKFAVRLFGIKALKAI